MEQTVNSLNGEVAKAKGYIDKERGRLESGTPAKALPAGETPSDVARIL